jgi:hypothetical protein
VSLALNFPLLDVGPYWLATVLVAANNVALVRLLGPAQAGHCERHGEQHVVSGSSRTSGTTSGLSKTVISLLAVTLLFVAARAWLNEILIYPHDPNRADMLVVIQLGIRRLLQGRTPYAMYDVPWPATLPYGPVMWAPMIVPYLLHADVRVATVAGALVVPAACAIAAIAWTRRADVTNALGCVLLLAAIALSPNLRGFMSIGHTPAYWPLLPIFAWALHRQRWTTAAILCGLLIVARTTMVSLVPALVIAVWQRDRSRTLKTVAALVVAVVLPLLPFAIADLPSVQYAFYGSYQTVIKGYVWTSTTWAQNTVGVTGLLLARGWRAAVEPVQTVAMLAVAAATWIRLRRGDDASVWAAFGLLVFSMTTLWPVVYVYFDVFLLFASAAVVRGWPATARGAWPAWGRTLAAAAVALFVTAVLVVPLHASIDVGRASARRFLYAGFSGDEHAADRDYAWVDGTRATLLVPSLARGDATIAIMCEPYITAKNGRQQLTAALNGIVLGTADIGDGWQQVSWRAPARAWQIGANELTLFLSSAISPYDAGEGRDTRRLSIAVDRLNVTAP